jgi:hypothetical protein
MGNGLRAGSCKGKYQKDVSIAVNIWTPKKIQKRKFDVDFAILT